MYAHQLYIITTDTLSYFIVIRHYCFGGSCGGNSGNGGSTGLDTCCHCSIEEKTGEVSY